MKRYNVGFFQTTAMLKKLLAFLENNYPDSNINDYLDAKYIQLTNPQLKQIADALHANTLQIKPASRCVADNFIFHFGNTLIFLKKDLSNASAVYQAELAWETDFLAIHSARNKGKGFYFIAFEFDDNYQINLKQTDKTLESQLRNEAKDKALVEQSMPVIKGFMSAISE